MIRSLSRKKAAVSATITSTTAMVLVMVALTSVFFLFADLVISHVVQFVLQLGR